MGATGAKSTHNDSAAIISRRSQLLVMPGKLDTLGSIGKSCIWRADHPLLHGPAGKTSTVGARAQTGARASSCAPAFPKNCPSLLGSSLLRRHRYLPRSINAAMDQ